MILKLHLVLAFAGLAVLASPPVMAEEPSDELTSCVGEIRRVCVNLEDELETCLAQRGPRLSAHCREQLQAAMTLMKDPSGPGACVADVKHSCGGLQSDDLARCIVEKWNEFSPACQKYLDKLSAAQTPE
jgi:exonuclease VII small subunit